MSCIDEPFEVPPDPFLTNEDPFLITGGGNKMLAPLEVIAGDLSRLSIVNWFTGRDGFYFPTNSIAAVIDGIVRFLVTTSAITFYVGRYAASITHINTAGRTYILPDKSGTVALVKDVENWIDVYLITKWY